jgi:hypothetical protein
MSKMTSPAIVGAIYLEAVSAVDSEIVTEQWGQLAHSLGGWFQELGLEPTAIHKEATEFFNSFSNPTDRRAAVLELAGELKKSIDATEDEDCMASLMLAVADASGDAYAEMDMDGDEDFLTQIFEIVGISWDELG